MLLLGISLYYVFTKNFPVNLIVVSIIELALLAALWIYHDKLHEAINYSNGIIAINKRHLDRISGKWSAFEDIGAEFINTEHSYCCDLDIVGKKSLFQFLNSTHTWHGRQAFANDLLRPVYSNDELLKRQDAISELSKKIELSNHMEYNFSKIGVNSSAQKLIADLKDNKKFINSKAIKIILKYLPLLTLAFIAAMLIFQLKKLYFIGVIIIFFQMMIWLAGVLKTQKYISAITDLPYRLSSYGAVFEMLKNMEFASEKLLQIQKQLRTSNISAANAIKELGKISDKVNARHNGIIYFTLNVLLLWDYECALMLEEWKAKYAHMSGNWFLALGEFESLLCFSNLVNLCNTTCLPVIADTSKKNYSHRYWPSFAG